MGIEAHGLDLHSGFNILKAAHSRSSAQAVRFGVIAPAVSLHSDERAARAIGAIFAEITRAGEFTQAMEAGLRDRVWTVGEMMSASVW
jgi:hypothetical protein